MQEQPRERIRGGGCVLGGLPHDGVAAQERGHEVPRGHRNGEVARGDDGRSADRHAEGEQLLVGHLRRDGVPVEPPTLPQEEVAGVDDLLDLAAGLADRLADLPRDQLRERLEVRFHEAAELLDHSAAHGCGDSRPRRLRCTGDAAGLHEGGVVGEGDLGHHVVEMCRVQGGERAAGRAVDGGAGDDRGDGSRHVLMVRARSTGSGGRRFAVPRPPEPGLPFRASGSAWVG